jgi:hypothetical protein
VSLFFSHILCLESSPSGLQIDKRFQLLTSLQECAHSQDHLKVAKHPAPKIIEPQTHGASPLLLTKLPRSATYSVYATCTPFSNETPKITKKNSSWTGLTPLPCFSTAFDVSTARLLHHYSLSALLMLTPAYSTDTLNFLIYPSSRLLS